MYSIYYAALGCFSYILCSSLESDIIELRYIFNLDTNYSFCFSFENKYCPNNKCTLYFSN